MCHAHRQLRNQSCDYAEGLTIIHVCMNWHIYDTKVDSGNDLMARSAIKSLKAGLHTGTADQI